MKIINPANGNTIENIDSDTKESIINKFNKAKDFFPNFSKSEFQSRKEAINKFSLSLQTNAMELAITQTAETGKPVKQAKSEILAVRDRIKYFLDNTEKLMQKTIEHTDGNLQESIEWQPLGVVLNISAWNYPWFTGANVFIPALLTGNVVLYKPSEYSTKTGLLIQELLIDSGIPEHAFQAVIGDGSVGSLLTDLPINAVFFTGSYATGKKISQAVAGKMIPVQMELGGKDPSYICEDVDLKSVAEATADGAFYNAGQSCCSIERIYVHEKIYDQFLEAFVGIVNNFKVGVPTSEDTYLGPLVNPQAVEKINNQVQDALAKKAKLLIGGKRIENSGNFFEPTVFSEVDHSMDLMVEESFGPIIGIQKVKDDEQAIELMNDTKYGLTAGVFTKDQDRAQNILSQIRSGTAYWNCSDRVSPYVPWTSRGHSGLGSTLSRIGIRAFLQPRSWHLKKI